MEVCIILIFVFVAFWFPAYFKATYPTDKNLDNNIFQFVSGDIVKEASTNYSLVVLSKDNNGVLNINYFIRTPFNRAIKNATGELKEINGTENVYKYMGNSTIDKKMFIVVYGYNSTSDYLILKSDEKDYKKEIPKGYFVTKILMDNISDVDSTNFY